MKHYETMFIIKPTLQEGEIKTKIDFFKDIITKNEGVIETCLDMGMRNLAYEIKKNKRGYYFVIYFQSNPSLIAELERNYRINEDILRFLIVKYESKKEQKAWQTLVDRANGKVETPKRKPRERVEKPENSTKEQDSVESNQESTES